MLPKGGAHITPNTIGNFVHGNLKYVETDIAFHFNFCGIATTQLGINGIDQVPGFRIICRCFVSNAQPILVENTIVFVKFTRKIYKLDRKSVV